MLKRVQVVLGKGTASGARRHTLVMAVALCSLSWSGLAAALGMGEIRLHSALNQPLNAEIQLIETAGLDPEDIVVKLASPEAFAKAGLERGFFLNDLRFTPVIRGNSGYIEVSSSKAVVEPYLNFMVQLARPNGDLLHEYTLLLDPATTPEGMAATRDRKALQEKTGVTDSRMPVAPPMAVQGKHYTVVNGDTLSSIARRLQGPGGKGSPAQLAEGIQALNPLTFPNGPGSALKAGQNLLLPDAAVLPSPPTAEQSAGATATPAKPAAQDAQKAAQLVGEAIETQQLDDLKSLNRSLQEQVFERDKAVTVLQARLAEMRDAARAPAPATVAGQPGAALPPGSATPAGQPAAAPLPVAAAAGESSSLFSLPLLIGLAVVLLGLLVALRWRQRRAPRAEPVEPLVRDEPLIKPAQSAALPVYEVPPVAPQAAPPAATAPASAPGLSKAPASQRLAGAAPDALDGVSIYIAYGRFNEALGILRDALEKQPEREDIRERILELLAEQGDVVGFDREERQALERGMDAGRIQAIRARYPQLKPSQGVGAPPTPATDKSPGTSPATAATVAAGVVAGAGAATLAAAALAERPSQPAPATPPAQLDETAAAALNPEHVDEFQLNLDDLSMDADWDLVDPFDKPPSHGKADEAQDPQVDPNFASNLTELPEVLELQDEPFLGDVAEPMLPVSGTYDLSDVDLDSDSADLLDGLGDYADSPVSGIEAIDIVESSDSDALDEAFLDSFADEEGMEFDLLELDEEPLTQINQAQLLIDEGNLEGARRLLQQVIDEADEAHQQMARDLLASLD